MSDLKNIFKSQCFEGDALVKEVMDGPGDEIRAFCDNRKQVYYRLVPGVNGKRPLFMLEFWVDTYADDRSDLQKKLRAAINDNIRVCGPISYYSAFGCQLRRRITNEAELKADVDELKGVVSEVVQSVKGRGQTIENGKCGLGIVAISAQELLNKHLRVPDYQRTYCWDGANIRGLLDDIYVWQQKHKGEDQVYHIGTVVLREPKNDSGYFDIIDGQQRLTTLAIYLKIALGSNLVFELGQNNTTNTAMKCLKAAKDTIEDWSGGGKEGSLKIDLARVRLSAVVIGKDQPDDLAFRFFNHINSMGKPLTDYELLKGHHLRYISGDDESKIMANRWKDLDGVKDELLHFCLYRIRRWLEHDGNFPLCADDPRHHALFHEFSLDFEPTQNICTPYKPSDIDSFLSGGVEFFDYVERYRRLFNTFISIDCVNKDLDGLKWHSYGTLYRGILSLSFFFYAKFGDVYLKQAIVEIAKVVSVLRNASQIRQTAIRNSIFSTVARIIDRSTHESEFLGKMRSPQFAYVHTNTGNAASEWWSALVCLQDKKNVKGGK